MSSVAPLSGWRRTVCSSMSIEPTTSCICRHGREGRRHRRGPRAPAHLPVDQAHGAPTPRDRDVNEPQTGQTVDATVTRVMPYGAFARLAHGVEGLIQVTELGGEKVAGPTASYASARCCGVQIVAIDRERRRLSLSARLAGAHMERCPEGGRVRIRTYNRNQMMPAPIYGPEEL